MVWCPINNVTSALYWIKQCKQVCWAKFCGGAFTKNWKKIYSRYCIPTICFLSGTIENALLKRKALFEHKTLSHIDVCWFRINMSILKNYTPLILLFFDTIITSRYVFGDSQLMFPKNVQVDHCIRNWEYWSLWCLSLHWSHRFLT